MNKVKVNPLTRRECTLYHLGAYEMLLSHAKTETGGGYLTSMIIEFVHAYMPEYNDKQIHEFFELCTDEKTNGTARKLFDKRHQEFTGGESI